GDSFESQMLADDLEKRFLEDTSVRFSYLPVLRALLALNRRDPRGAIASLQRAVPYELSWQGACTVGLNGSLYPRYAPGLAFQMAGQGAEAATEFQKILDPRGTVVTNPIGALAHLELGRAFVLAGDQTKAKAALSRFPRRLEKRRSRTSRSSNKPKRDTLGC